MGGVGKWEGRCGQVGGEGRGGVGRWEERLWQVGEEWQADRKGRGGQVRSAGWAGGKLGVGRWEGRGGQVGVL